jgi:hypothetical protein
VERTANGRERRTAPNAIAQHSQYSQHAQYSQYLLCSSRGTTSSAGRAASRSVRAHCYRLQHAVRIISATCRAHFQCSMRHTARAMVMVGTRLHVAVHARRLHPHLPHRSMQHASLHHIASLRCSLPRVLFLRRWHAASLPCNAGYEHVPACRCSDNRQCDLTDRPVSTSPSLSTKPSTALVPYGIAPLSPGNSDDLRSRHLARCVARRSDTLRSLCVRRRLWLTNHGNTARLLQVVFYPNPTKLQFSVCLPECPANFTMVCTQPSTRRASPSSLTTARP